MVKTGKSPVTKQPGAENIIQEAVYGLRKSAADVGAVGSDSEVTGKLGERL